MRGIITQVVTEGSRCFLLSEWQILELLQEAINNWLHYHAFLGSNELVLTILGS